MMTRKQLEMMKDLHLVTRRGSAGLSISKDQRKNYTGLERDQLVYFLLHAGRECSIRLTDKGKAWTMENFAYAYKDQPQRGQTTYQDASGNITLVVNGVAP